MKAKYSSRRLHWSPEESTWQEWLRAHPVNWRKCGGLLPAIVQNVQTRQVLMQGFMNPEALEQSLRCGNVCFFSRSKQRLWCKGESSGNRLQICELALDCDCDSLLILAWPCGPTCHEGSNSCYSTPFPKLQTDKKAEKTAAAAIPAEPGRELCGPGADWAQQRESLGVGWLGALEAIIEHRLDERSYSPESLPPGKPEKQGPNPEPAKPGYVQQLFEDGLQRIAQKVGEEGVEVALAAMALAGQTGRARQCGAAGQQQLEQQAEPLERLRCELAGEAADLLFHLLILLKACDMKLQDAVAVLEERHLQSLLKQQADSK